MTSPSQSSTSEGTKSDLESKPRSQSPYIVKKSTTPSKEKKPEKHEIKTEIEAITSKDLDVVRMKRNWSLKTSLRIAMRLLRLHVWAFENGETIKIGNDEITIEELHGTQ